MTKFSSLEEALNDLDNKRVLNFVSKKFKRTLPWRIRQQCKYIAAWRTMKYFEKTTKTYKFTTILYYNMRNECLIEYKLCKHSSTSGAAVDCITFINFDEIEREDVISLLKPEIQTVVRLVFSGFSIDDIAKKLGLKRSKVGRIREKGLTFIRAKLLEA